MKNAGASNMCKGINALPMITNGAEVDNNIIRKKIKKSPSDAAQEHC